MSKVDKFRKKATEELNFFDTRTNLKFEGEESPNLLGEIIAAKTEKELNRLRFDIIQLYSDGVLSISEELLDSFALADTRHYNDRLAELKDNFDKIFVEEEKIDEEAISKARNLFDSCFKLYKTLQKNERCFLMLERKEFYGKIFPAWAAIISTVYVGIIVTLINKEIIIFSGKNLGIIIAGWALIIISLGFLLNWIVHRRRNNL